MANGEFHSSYLYDPELLHGLEWNSAQNKVTPFITNEQPGEDYFLVRPLQIDDYEKGFLQLLSQLTTVGDITQAEYEAQFRKMQKAGCYFVTVIEDIRHSKIIGAATLVTEMKFIHKCGMRARLEDVVVNNTYRGKQLGKLIVLTVTLLAKKIGCYKMSLDCKDPLIPFYKTLGYTLEPGNANTMMLRYESKL
ncbi:probable glucosamine 6-phosphate N-acetyltransferase isoform X2 [Anthonomus grandis grandis]|uniref:probable glucosamine 6-phosphate N-acetyltransferase isoform X2 n=1 Tax=Anthonomus grandis grandis TaxID=2921223 RepID=UPI00216509E4|nr:probable glucosamine 6-phosphate N-acetyltransferase isoform X2 [Anthonomus grandis grandis]